MRIFIVFLLSVALPAVASAQHDKALAARGEKVYVEQKCAICHAIAGKGNAKGALDDVGARLSADEIRTWIVDAPAMTAKTKAARKPAMKAYANIPPDDVAALVAYLQTLKKK